MIQETNPGCPLEGQMLTLKLKSFGRQMRREELFGEDSDVGENGRQQRKGTAEDEMVRQWHQHNEHDSAQTLGGGGGRLTD